MPGSNLSYVSATQLATSTWGAGDAPQAGQWMGSVAGFTMQGGRTVQMISDGTRWKPIGPFIVLQPNASVTATVDETTLASTTIPAGLLGTDGSIRITAIFTFVGTAGIKTMRAKFGGVTFVNSGPANTTLSASIFRTISNITASSQVAIPVTAAEGNALASTTVVGSVDTTVDQSIVISAQLANAADRATLVKLIVEIL